MNSLPNVGQISKVFLSKARDDENRQTRFVNGDRYVFATINPDYPLPEQCLLNDHTCRIWYASRNSPKSKCKRCMASGHKAEKADECPAYIDSPPENYVLFRNGIFSNFHPTPVTMSATTFSTSEHSYQWRACEDHMRDDLAELVVSAKKTLKAKQIPAPIKGDSWETKNKTS